VLLAPAYATIGKPGTPPLMNRRLRLNPLSTVLDELAAKAGAADLWFAAAVDRSKWAVGAAAAAGLALGLVSQLLHGRMLFCLHARVCIRAWGRMQPCMQSEKHPHAKHMRAQPPSPY